MNDEKISKIKLKLSNALKDDKIKKLIIVLCIVGIGLIFISTFIGGRSGSESESKKASQNKDSYTDLSEYKDSIQDELSKIISKIDGVGKAEVFLTLDNSSENVYAVNQKQSTVNHVHDPFNFPTKVGVAWRIQDVDRGILVLNRGVL